MRNLKKFLALVLAMIMVVSAAAVVSADFTDIEGNRYAEAINDLAVKKIIVGTTETTFSPDADVQRYQMALLVARATTGIVDNADWANGVKIFDDVTDDHFKGAISYAFVNGIIKGRDAKTFDPAGNIAYIDALTMAVRALGFNDLEYPMGYYKKAAELGLTDDVAVYELDATLDRAETAQIIYNMIYVVRENGLTMAAEYFDRVVVRTSDLFVISCTPKQTYAVKYEASTNKNETFVGIQPLVNGVPNGEVIYLTTAQLGIEKADVEKYFSYAVELVNFDKETGKFDEAKLGAAPDVYRNADVTYTPADKTFTIAGKKYDAVPALTNNVRRNEFVAIAGETFSSTPAKMLLEDDLGQVWSKDGKVVAKRIPFSGETVKYYAVVDGSSLGVINEAKALELWGFATDKVEYAQYATLTADAISGFGAYQLQCFDDNKDGTYDRVFAYKVYMSVYNTSADGKTVYDIAKADSAKTVADVTFSDPSVQVKGTVYVYTYNEMTNTVNVIETVAPQTGTLQLIDATALKVDTRGKVAFYIDGTRYVAASVKDGATINYTVGSDFLGAEFIANPDTDTDGTTYADIAAKGVFEYTNAYSWINDIVPNKKVNFYFYGKTPILLFAEEVKSTTATPTKNIVVTAGGKLNVDETIENLLVDIYKDGVLAAKTKFDSIQGKVFAELNILEQAQFLLDAKSVFFPGIIYKTTVNADGEYAITKDAAFNPYDADNYGTLYGFKAVPDATKDGNKIVFKSGITTAPGYENKIFTDKDTIFYFIDRTANTASTATVTVDGEATKVGTFVGGPVDAYIEYNAATRVFVDKIGLDGFADVVIVYDAEKISGFGYQTAASSVVYVPQGPSKVTKVGTAAALGLTDAKYAENNYYMYANAAIDLQTGAKVTIITTEELVANNTNKIYKLDANNVVIEEADANGDPLANRTSTLYMSLDEAVTAGVLATHANATLKYVPIYTFVELHANNAEIIGHTDAVKTAVIFAEGAEVKDENILVNDKTKDVIAGNKTVYYLATGLADGSIVVIYK